MSTADRRIGRYLLLDPLGRGAMGVVYRAEDPFIHRNVAVKVLHPAVGLSPHQTAIERARFMREAQSAGGIDHPHIVRIYDVGEDEAADEMYIVMEYIPGRSLEELILESSIDIDRAVEIVGQIASGLDAAHQQGIIHRDIKPSNILFTETGDAKIVDFGITQVASVHLTQDMAKLGTPAYMSPEQIECKPLDRRSDLFSLGVLTYEMLTGRKPFAGTDVVSIAHAIAHAEPEPASEVNPELPQALDGVLARMLSKNPADRYADGMEFHRALRAVSEQPGAAPAPPPRTRRPWSRGLLWGTAAAAMLAIVLVSLRSDPPRRVTSSAVAAAKPAPRVSAPARISAPTTKVTISLTHRLRHGTLTLTLDGKPVFREAFTKPMLAISQTTTWDPFDAPTGAHKLRAKLQSDDGAIYQSDAFPIELKKGRGIELRLRIKRDELTFQPRPQAG